MKSASIFSFYTFFAWCVAAASTNAYAERVVLSDQGKLVADYDSKVLKVRPGNTIVIGGREFKVETVFKSGNNTVVFTDSQLPGVVIRIPIKTNRAQYINETIDGVQELQKGNIGHPNIIESERGLFIVQQRIDIETSFQHFIYAGAREPGFIEKKNALLKFFESTAAYKEVGDFKLENIVFDKEKGWVLLDWTNDHARVQLKSVTDIFVQNTALYHISSTSVLWTNDIWPNGIIAITNARLLLFANQEGITLEVARSQLAKEMGRFFLDSKLPHRERALLSFRGIDWSQSDWKIFSDALAHTEPSSEVKRIFGNKLGIQSAEKLTAESFRRLLEMRASSDDLGFEMIQEMIRAGACPAVK